MPLYDVPFQAGVTAILEAISMEKAVIVTRTQGQTDVIIDEVTGLYVEPGDPNGLRAAIRRLLDHSNQATTMGVTAHQVVLDEMSLERYAIRLNSYINNDRM